MPSSTIAGSRSAHVGAVDRHAREQEEAGDDRCQRREQHVARPEAGVQARREAQREDADGQRDRQERRAGADGVVAEHPLEVQDREEEHAEHARRPSASAPGSRPRRCGSAGRAAAAAAARRSPGARRRPPAARRRRRPAAASGRRRSCRRRASARRSPAPRPARRRRRAGRGPPPARSSARPSSHAATPIGTLTKKIQCQSSAWVSTPPASRPIDAPAEATNEKTPIAFPCSPGSGNIVTIMPRITAELSAPPTPWMKRAAISISGEPDSPHSSEASVKTARPARKIVRRPIRSPSRPASSSRPPNAIRYALIDPRQAGGGEAEVGLDGRQGHVHDRLVEDDHEHPRAQDHEGQPAGIAGSGLHGRRLLVRGHRRDRSR